MWLVPVSRCAEQPIAAAERLGVFHTSRGLSDRLQGVSSPAAYNCRGVSCAAERAGAVMQGQSSLYSAQGGRDWDQLLLVNRPHQLEE